MLAEAVSRSTADRGGDKMHERTWTQSAVILVDASERVEFVPQIAGERRANLIKSIRLRGLSIESCRRVEDDRCSANGRLSVFQPVIRHARMRYWISVALVLATGLACDRTRADSVVYLPEGFRGEVIVEYGCLVHAALEAVGTGALASFKLRGSRRW